MTITIVTPWYEHPELLPDYANAISQAYAEIIIVDNGGAPKRKEWRTLSMPFNTGYARACNAGLKAAKGDAVLFLNNDIRMVNADWLERLRDAMEPGVLVGANIRYDEHADVNGHKLPYLDGWCIGGMRDELLELGGFDEKLEEPAYYSDNLLCLHARAAGMTLREVKIGLRHKLNQTVEGHPNREQATINNCVYYREVAGRVLEPVA